MPAWTKRQRLEAVVNGEPADRPPVSAWRHFVDRENSAESLAGAMVKFQRDYDWDFMKINPRAVYYHETWGNEYDYTKYIGVLPTLIRHTVQTTKDLEKIEEHPADQGPLGEQLAAIRLIRQELGNEVPLFQTIFSPLAILLNLTGSRSVGRNREAPREESPLIKLFEEDREGVHKALKAIANTMARYAAATLETGADGAFYASLGMARTGYLTTEEFDEFSRPYDFIVLEALESAPTILHTCGIYANPQRFVDYPVNIIQWAEHAAGNPSIADSAAWIGRKAVLGGVDEGIFGTGATDVIATQAAQAVQAHANRPFMLGPECSVSLSSSDAELRTLRMAPGK